MSDSNRALDAPAGDDAQTDFQSGVDAIAGMIGPGTPDPEQEADESETEVADEAEADEDGVEPDESEDADESDDDDEAGAEEDDDGPDGFAGDDLKVTMADGQTITVAELRDHADKRIKDMQRTFTEKTSAAAARSREVEQAAQTLAQQRDFLQRVMEAYTPHEPDPALLDTDPVSYMQAKDAYDRSNAALQHILQQTQWDQQRQEAERQRTHAERIKERDREFFERVPAMRNEKRLQQFGQDIQTVGAEAWGITMDDVLRVADARQLQILSDAIEFRKLKAKAPAARRAVEGKPKMLRAGKRSNPKSKASRSRKQRADRLAKTGSLEAGIAALQDFDL